MAFSTSASVLMTPYRHPTGPLATSQISFSTPGPCTTYFIILVLLFSFRGTPGKSSWKRPNGKESSLKKEDKAAIVVLPTYEKLQFLVSFEAKFHGFPEYRTSRTRHSCHIRHFKTNTSRFWILLTMYPARPVAVPRTDLSKRRYLVDVTLYDYRLIILIRAWGRSLTRV